MAGHHIYLPPDGHYMTLACGVRILEGDCLDVLRRFDNDIFHLIVTSPPYANQRKQQYGGVPADEYAKWFLPRAAEMLRVLKPSGSFVLNIKEHVHDGERHPYVYKLVLAMREQGWKLVDEMIWAKKNTMPGRRKGRLKDGWEHLYHFTKTLDYTINLDAVRTPLKPQSIKAAQYKAKRPRANAPSLSGSGIAIKDSKILAGIESGEYTTTTPPNVLHIGNSHGTKHPAAFPRQLPEFFIKLLSNPGDLVLDPFVGSGTTCDAAFDLGRRSIGIEAKPEYAEKLFEKYKDIYSL